MALLGQVVACGHNETDLSDLGNLRTVVSNVFPQVIVNAAAYTAVDKAESEQELAFRVNSEGVGVLATEVTRLASLFIHYSTDYVFAGTKEAAYEVTDATDPLGIYGRSKLAGEGVIRVSGCRNLIFRASWVYAPRSNNFIKTILRLDRDRDEIKVVCDQVGAPTSAELLADVTACCLYRIISDTSFFSEQSGVYHLTASGKISWYGFALFIVNEALKKKVLSCV